MLSLRIIRQVEVSFDQVVQLASWAERVFPCDNASISMTVADGRARRNHKWTVRKPRERRGTFASGWLINEIEARMQSNGITDEVDYIQCFGLDATPALKDDLRGVQWLCYPQYCFPESLSQFVAALCVAVRLDRVRGAVIDTILDGMKTLLPICCKSDPRSFGVLEVERATYCGFGTEPQRGTFEVGVQRQVLHRLWEIKLREEACVLPHVAWVNVMPAELLLRLGKDLEEVRTRLVDIVCKRDVEHMVRIETLPLPAGAAAVMILPIHFDNVNELYETEYADATHMLFCEVLYDVTKWWRAANVIA
jgi:hypothetical protein